MLFAVIAMGLFVPADRANAATENRFAGQGVSHGGLQIDWTNVANVVSDNNADANTDKVPSGFDSDELHDWLLSRNYGFTIPAGATILGIEVEVEIWDANATLDMDDSDARLVKADVLVGADRSIAGVWPSTRTVRTYGSPTDLWGTTWTPAEVNAAGFGFALQPRALSANTGAIAHADYHRIIVYFTGLELTKAFGTDPIAPGGVSTLTLTISNSYAFPLTGVAVSDTYPIEITNSTPNNGATTCAGGAVTAVDGGPSVSLSGATMPASSSCTVTVDVTSTTPGGPYVNTTGTVTANEVPPSSTATDSLTVTAGGGNVCPSWALQASGTAEALRAVHFPVSNVIGYAAGNAGTILKTMDGGTNWNPLPSAAQNLNGIYFPVDVSTGWVIGNAGLILKTIDGGASWVAQVSGTAENLNGIHFPVDALTGYVVGKTGVIRKTTDGGANWNPLPSAADDLSAVQFPVDATTGYAVGKSGLITKTTNGGTSWTPQASGTTNTLAGVNFPVDTLTGWTSGNTGTILKTTDGGSNWNPQISATGDNLDDIQFPTTTSTGYLIGKFGRVMDTTNGGANWTLDASVPTAQDLRAMHFPVDATTGYITGNNGTILKCGVGGAGGSPAVTSALAEISPNDVATSSTANAFSYDIDATIGGGDTGVDRVAITVPVSFTTVTVTDVLVGGVSVAYTDNTVGNDISVDLTAKVTVNDRITVLFDADAPTTEDLTGVDFLSSVDDSGTAYAPQATTEGNGDGDAGDANSWTVTTTDGATGDVYYSVGTNAADLKNGSPTLSIASGTATLTVAQTGNIGVGDEIDYDTGNKIAYIKSVISPTQFVVHTATGGVPGNVTTVTVNAIRRAFNTLATAEANSGDASHLTTFDLTATGADATLTWVSYNDAVFTTGVIINGYTTNATRFITLTVAGASQVVSGMSQRHNGTAGTGVVVDMGALATAAIRMQDNFVTVEWLELKGGSGSTAHGLRVESITAPSKLVVRNSLIHNMPGQGIRLDDADIDADIYNNIIYEVAVGIRPTLTLAQARILNNTIYRCNDAGFGEETGINGSGTNVTLRNNIAHSNVGGDYKIAGIDAASSNNLASDTTGTTHSPAGGGQDSVPLGNMNFVSTTAGSEDLHIAGGSVAINAGADLSGIFTDDIDADTRPIAALWEIGADETSAAGAAIDLVKRAFWLDGTPIPTGVNIPNGVEFKYLLYINNTSGAVTDVSVRDVLDAAFQYQTPTIQVDNSVAECALAACTVAEELTIFTAVDGAAVLTDAADGDVASYTGASTSVDAGNENVANLQLDINANAVWAILFSVKML